MASAFIVAEDMSGRFEEGGILTPKQADMCKGTGAILLPVNPSLMQVNGGAGYARRKWGNGWPVPSVMPKHFAAVAMFVAQKTPRIHYAARLKPATGREEAFERGDLTLSGSLRLATDTGQQHVMSGGLHNTHDGNLSKLDYRDGGWVLEGSASLYVPAPGFFGFSLFGAAPNIRVEWMALSQDGNTEH